MDNVLLFEVLDPLYPQLKKALSVYPTYHSVLLLVCYLASGLPLLVQFEMIKNCGIFVASV